MTPRLLLILCARLVGLVAARAQDPETPPKTRLPKPDHANVAYDPYKLRHKDEGGDAIAAQIDFLRRHLNLHSR